MPRVSIKKQEYAKKDFIAFLVGWMRIEGVKQNDLAEALNVSKSCLSYKIKNASFTFDDLYAAFTYLDVPGEEIAKLMRSSK